MPYGPPRIKAVRKAQKLCLWDWSEVEDEGARFENLVESQLLNFCHFEEDTKGLEIELRYFKDGVTEKEIDFIVLQKGKPLFAVECKTGEKNLSRSLILSFSMALDLKYPNSIKCTLAQRLWVRGNRSRTPVYQILSGTQSPLSGGYYSN
jgi:predicted AAA+ superfamily ATPase